MAGWTRCPDRPVAQPEAGENSEVSQTVGHQATA